MIADPLVFSDEPDYRVLDLRPDGVTGFVAVGMSNFNAMREVTDLHYHPGALEICLCIKGNLTFETTETEYKFLPGTIFVSLPTQPHRLKNNPKGLKLYRLLFRIQPYGSRFLGLDKRESEWLSRSLTNLPKRMFASTPNVKAAFDRIFDLYDNSRPSPGRRARMKSAALELLISIVDAARRTPRKAPSGISELARRIRENPEADYPVAGMARVCNLSVSAFQEVFKRAMGLPLHAYLINSRIMRAKKLLETTRRTIDSVAQELRFKSKPHFSVTFKRIIGLTPHAFRQGHSARPTAKP